MSYNGISSLKLRTIVTGGSHNSCGSILSKVNSTASGSPGEQTSHNCLGPSDLLLAI